MSLREPDERPVRHLWTVAGEDGVSHCENGCGVRRLLTGRRTHRVLFSRGEDGNATWRAEQPPCAPRVE